MADIQNSTAPSVDPLVQGLFEGEQEQQTNQGEQVPSQPEISVDIIKQHPYFKGLQSKYDSTANENKTLNDLVSQIATDPEVRRAFIAEYEPDLFKAPDPKDYVQNNLKKEFGDDFEQTLENGSAFQKMQINERYAELKAEAKKLAGGSTPKKFKEVIEARKTAETEQYNDFLRQKNEALKEFNIDENTFQASVNWAGKLGVKDFIYMYLRASKKTNIKPASPLEGGSGVNLQSTEFEKMNKTFGKPEVPWYQQ